jgi:hypothetical protein
MHKVEYHAVQKLTSLGRMFVEKVQSLVKALDFFGRVLLHEVVLGL